MSNTLLNCMQKLCALKALQNGLGYNTVAEFFGLTVEELIRELRNV